MKLFILVFLLSYYSIAQTIQPFIYNKINFTAPSTPFSAPRNEIMNYQTQIYLDIDSKMITFITFYEEGPNTNTYEIEEISDLINNTFYRLKCKGSNYAEVYVDVEAKGLWINSSVTHNGINHLYYN